MGRRKQKHTAKAKIAEDHLFFGIIEDAYRVFNYRTPARTDVCENCCMAPEIEARFFVPPIAELPLHYLNDWYSAAASVEGVSKEVWAYLLPRILEVLAIDEELSYVGIEVSLNRFKSGNRALWSDQEWEVLDRFQRAYLDREARRETEFLDDTICMFALGGWPLEHLIEQIEAQPDDVLATRLWHDWCNGRPTIWQTAFWKKPDKDRIWEFYTSQRLYERMEALAYAADTQEILAEKALDVASMIQANMPFR